MKQTHPILLASGSPRRAELMKKAGYSFRTINPSADETVPDSLASVDVAEYLARHKSKHIIEHIKENEIAITADTIVLHQDEILGKPADSSEAKHVLQSLSNRTHEVITGVCLRTRQKQLSFSCASEVKFGTLTQEEIDYYVASGDPFDKAGSYAIQEWIGICRIEWIRGSYTNIIGLPMFELYEQLKGFPN